MISQDIQQQVIAAANANMDQIVGEYTTLQPGSHENVLVATCPFDNDKAKSFFLRKDVGIFNCCKCHRSGGVVKFVMEAEQLSTTDDAILFLANKLGLAVGQQGADLSNAQAAYQAAMEFAANFFQQNMRESAEGMAIGLSYFKWRGLSDDTIETFRLGYSLEKPDALGLAAMQAGFNLQTIKDMDLGFLNANGYGRDKFVGRAMFPIQNVSGKVIAFGGRKLDKETKGVEQKYVNSSETPLYSKRRSLYGIFQARQEMVAQDKCFLVEGYIDVLSMYQAGLRNVVASNGTSLTPEQIKLIRRFTRNVTVIYDGDSAGIHASLKSINLFLNEGMVPHMLLLPGGQDPDEFARSHSAEEIAAYVAEHETDFMTFEVQQLMAEADGDPFRLQEAVHIIVGSIALIEEISMRQDEMHKCAVLLAPMGISEEAISSELQTVLTENAIKQRNEHIAKQRAETLRNQGVMPPAAPAPMSAATFSADAYADPFVMEEMAMRAFEMEEAARAGVPMAPEPAPAQQPLPAAAPSKPDPAMREVVRFLITYPQEVLPQFGMTVCNVILNDLEQDDIHSSEHILNKILSVCRSVTDRSMLTTAFLMSLPNLEVTDYVAQIVGGREELSKFHSRYIKVESEETLLNDLVPRALNEVRLNEVLHRFEEKQQELTSKCQAGADEQEIEALMEDLEMLNKMKKMLSDEMGRRTVLSLR